MRSARVVLDNATPEVVKLVEDGKMAVSVAVAVANRFETSRRHEVLSFSHHREVAALPAPEADAPRIMINV